MLKRERLGKDVFMRGIKGSIKSIYHQQYSLTLYELLKTYSSIIMTKDFQVMNIPKLPVYTTEDGIERIRNFFGKLNIAACFIGLSEAAEVTGIANFLSKSTFDGFIAIPILSSNSLKSED